MLNVSDFKEIPGFEDYLVNEVGKVKHKNGMPMKHEAMNGYRRTRLYIDGVAVMQPTHRLVALAWIPNPKPEEKYLVNHKDGVKDNNHHQNLEWCNFSENNYHAVNTGLRPDNIPVEVRDFHTKEVKEFPSLAQAAVFVGLPQDTQVSRLMPKQYGRLVKDRYEMRYKDSEEPWFYENRIERVPNSRYMVIVDYPDGMQVEMYSNQRFIQQFKLWNLSLSLPNLIPIAKERFPELKFRIRDAYEEGRKRQERKAGKRDEYLNPVFAYMGKDMLEFRSITQCSMYFKVDRCQIKSRIDTDKHLSGWKLKSLEKATPVCED